MLRRSLLLMAGARKRQSDTKCVGLLKKSSSCSDKPIHPMFIKKEGSISSNSLLSSESELGRIDSDVSMTTTASSLTEEASSSDLDLSEEDLEKLIDNSVAELWNQLTDSGWKEALSEEKDKDYFRDLAYFVQKERKSKKVFPQSEDVFTAFNTTPYDSIKVIIIGQDPYHGDGQAHGLCFSVMPGVKTPPSLRNIYKELVQDVEGFETPEHGYLLPWAEQGILMLNATLTVQAHKANSHAKSGWQKFTDAAILKLSESKKDLLFLLWGGFAHKKGKHICRDSHSVIETFHPSPLSVTKWRNCRVFSRANKKLIKLGKDPINWRLSKDPTKRHKRTKAQLLYDQQEDDSEITSEDEETSSATSSSSSKVQSKLFKMATQDDHQILESKFKLLETGRKMYFEDSQSQLKAAKEAVNVLRRENKEYKKNLRAIQDEKKSEKECVQGHIQDKELSQLDQRIIQLRKSLDECKHHNDVRQQQIDSLREQLRAIELVKPDVLDMDPGLSRKIRMLENRLDKSMIKYNEAQAIRKTYEQIVKRLKEERIGFDNQLAAIERTLKAKDHDYQELLSMSHDAIHANAISKAELAQFRAAYEEERRQKDIELSERKQAVQKRIDQTQRLERKEKHSKQREVEAAAPKQEEEHPKQQTIEPAPEEQEKLRQYEEAFAKIKEATGVTDVQEVIQKFITQEDTHRNLLEMKETTQAKIDSINIERANLKAKLEELKYSGSGQLGSRRIVDEFEAHLQEARHQCEKNCLKYERAAKLLINVKAGVEHLSEKLIDYKPKGEGEADDLNKLQVKEDNIIQVMEHCRAKLHMLTDEAGPTMGELDLSIPFEHSGVLPVTNRRIKLPTSDEEDNGEDDDDDEEEDVLDRETVKKLANLAVEREKKKSKKRGKKNKE